MKKWMGLILLVLAAGILTACRNAGGENQTMELPPEAEEGVLIYAALNPVSKSVQSSVEAFNGRNPNVQIEIRDYSDENGPERLLVELSAGRVPDIMELHKFGGSGEEIGRYSKPLVSDRPDGEYWMPYRQLIQKDYLEDLWPYIESDPELGREGVLGAPLKAAEVNGGLYMLFSGVRISTLMGPESLVGRRYGWTFEELMNVFSTMPDDSTILRYNATKWDVFFKLLCFTLDQYVDWETGRCSFDSEEFRNILAFLNSFPDEAKYETMEQAEGEIMWRVRNGRQMLEGIVMGDLQDIMYRDAIWGERAAYPGYPTADGGSGSFFNLRGRILAMSSSCRNKEAAWDFIRELIIHRYTLSALRNASVAVTVSIPVNLEDYKLKIRAELQNAKQIDLKKAPTSVPPASLFDDGNYSIYPQKEPSEEDVPLFEALINNTTQIYWPNDTLANVVWEAAGPYFAGDKTLDEAVDLIQRRVTLYVNENR